MHKNQHSLDSYHTKSALDILYRNSQHLKTIDTIKRSTISKSVRFLELAIFKQQLKNYFPKVYTHYQYFNKVRYYQTIFFSLAFLFLILGGIIFYQNIAFTDILFGDLRLLVRNSVSGLSACLAIFAAGIGYSLCVASEAAESLAYKARKKLAKIYTRKRIEFGVRGFLSFPDYNNDQALLLKAAYREIHDKINEKKAETIDLLREIRSTKGFDTGNHELLFSQALVDMDEQLKQYLQNFCENA